MKDIESLVTSGLFVTILVFLAAIFTFFPFFIFLTWLNVRELRKSVKAMERMAIDDHRKVILPMPAPAIRKPIRHPF